MSPVFTLIHLSFAARRNVVGTDSRPEDNFMARGQHQDSDHSSPRDLTITLADITSGSPRLGSFSADGKPDTRMHAFRRDGLRWHASVSPVRKLCIFPLIS